MNEYHLIASNDHLALQSRRSKPLLGKMYVVWSRSTQFNFPGIDDEGERRHNNPTVTPDTPIDAVIELPRFVNGLMLKSCHNSLQFMTCLTFDHKVKGLGLQLHKDTATNRYTIGHEEAIEPSVAIERYSFYMNKGEQVDSFCYYHPASLVSMTDVYEIWKTNATIVIVDRRDAAVVAVAGCYAHRPSDEAVIERCRQGKSRYVFKGKMIGGDNQWLTYMIDTDVRGSQPIVIEFKKHAENPCVDGSGEQIYYITKSGLVVKASILDTANQTSKFKPGDSQLDGITPLIYTCGPFVVLYYRLDAYQYEYGRSTLDRRLVITDSNLSKIGDAIDYDCDTYEESQFYQENVPYAFTHIIKRSDWLIMVNQCYTGLVINIDMSRRLTSLACAFDIGDHKICGFVYIRNTAFIMRRCDNDGTKFELVAMKIKLTSLPS